MIERGEKSGCVEKSSIKCRGKRVIWFCDASWNNYKVSDSADKTFVSVVYLIRKKKKIFLFI